jgi:hypothetical protein
MIVKAQRGDCCKATSSIFSTEVTTQPARPGSSDPGHLRHQRPDSTQKLGLWAAGFDTLVIPKDTGTVWRPVPGIRREPAKKHMLCSKGIPSTGSGQAVRSRFRAAGSDDPARACQEITCDLFLAKGIGPAYGLLSSNLPSFCDRLYDQGMVMPREPQRYLSYLSTASQGQRV